MKIKELKNNNFVKNVATLISGTVISQVFVFLIMPILTRLYSDELFGIYFVFVSSLNILKIATTLRFEIAIVLPKREKWAINAFATTIFITIIFSTFIFVICLFFKNFIIRIENLSKIADFIFLIPLSLLITGFWEAINFWNNRLKKYKKIAVGKITLSSTTGLTQLALGFKNFLNIGLILGLIFGQLLSMITLFILSVKSLAKEIKYISFKRMILVFKRYYHVPLYNSTINIIGNIANELPVYLFTGFYSPAVAGFYGMANKITATPMEIIGRSIGQVFYQKATEKHNNKESLKSLLKKTYINLLKLSILPVSALIILVPFLPFLLGEEWRGITIYIFIIFPVVYINFFIQPVSGIFTIKEKQKAILIFYIIMISFRFLGIWIGFYFFNNVIVSIFLLSFVTFTQKVYLFFWYLKISD